MTTTAVQGVITGALTDFGGTVLIILTAVIGVGVAYLAFRFGWSKIKGSLR